MLKKDEYGKKVEVFCFYFLLVQMFLVAFEGTT